MLSALYYSPIHRKIRKNVVCDYDQVSQKTESAANISWRVFKHDNQGCKSA